jgi:hypothetical protein
MGLSKADTEPSNRQPNVWPVILGVLLTLAGLLLRIAGARGDFWMDEILSLLSVSRVHSASEIVNGINNDNNHILNSLYLYALGSDQNPMAARSLAIFFGTAAIPVAGWCAWGLKKDSIAAIAAMLIAAIACPLVDCGSQARGYAGLEFSILLVLGILEQGPAWKTQPFWLGIAALLGLLNHFLMAIALVGFFIWQLWESRGSGPVQALKQTLKRFSVAILLSAGLAGFIALGLRQHPFHRIGGVVPSTVGGTLIMYGRLIPVLFGLVSPKWATIGLMAMIFALATALLASRRDKGNRAGAYVMFCVLLPLGLFLSGVTNLFEPRYFFFSWVILIVLLADLIGRGLAGGYAQRLVAIFAVIALIAGNTVALARFYHDGRSPVRDMIAVMMNGSGMTYGSDWGDNHIIPIDYFASKENVTLTYVAEDDFCSDRPAWFIHADRRDTPPSTITAGPPGCELVFDHPQVFRAWGLTSPHWMLYRRANAP